MNTWGHVPTGSIEILRLFGLNSWLNTELNTVAESPTSTRNGTRIGPALLCLPEGPQRIMWETVYVDGDSSTASLGLPTRFSNVIRRAIRSGSESGGSSGGSGLTTYGSSGVEAISVVEAAIIPNCASVDASNKRPRSQALRHRYTDVSSQQLPGLADVHSI
jgi:hypothetical protein